MRYRILVAFCLILGWGQSASGQVTFTDVSGSAGILPYAMQSAFGGGVAAEDFESDPEKEEFIRVRFVDPGVIVAGWPQLVFVTALPLEPIPQDATR